MNKTQWVVVASAVVLFSVLYFGFDTKPSGHRDIEEKRSLSAVTTDAGSLVLEAKKSLGRRYLNRWREIPNIPELMEKLPWNQWDDQ